MCLCTSARVGLVEELHSATGGEGGGMSGRQGNILGVYSSLSTQLVAKVEVNPLVQLV